MEKKKKEEKRNLVDGEGKKVEGQTKLVVVPTKAKHDLPPPFGFFRRSAETIPTTTVKQRSKHEKTKGGRLNP